MDARRARRYQRIVLRPGDEVGPYQIVEPIGAGGMGEVWRAHDKRLDRDVALKMLLEELAADGKKLERFEREARAAARIAHPNVVTVLDVGHHGGVPYVVSELLDGHTLAEAIAEGPLSASEVMRIGTDIADALVAAHRHGVIHRDLKPSNVMRLDDGRVKVVDFGIAKLLHDGRAKAKEGDTVSLATDTGTIIGTAGYMSPEQVAGLHVDTRSDLFSLGAILHELLSGQPAFGGQHAVERMVAILNEPPAALPDPQPGEPRGVRAVIARCLQKSPDDRYQSAAELAADLRLLSDPTIAALPSPRPVRSTTRRTLLAAAGGALAGAAGFYLSRPQAPLPAAAGPVVAAPAPSPVYRALSFRSGTIASARFLSDGESVVYGARFGSEPLALYSMRLSAPATQPMPLPAADIFAASSNGEVLLARDRRIGLWPGEGTLAIASLGGGVPREIAEHIIAADFAPAGEGVVIVRRHDGKCRLEHPLGRVLFETSGWIGDIRVSPKGDSIAFVHHPFVLSDSGAIMWVDFDGRSRTLSRGLITVQGVAWHPSGEEVWFSGASGDDAYDFAVRAVTLDGVERLCLRGPGRTRLHDIRRDGALLVTQDDFRSITKARHVEPLREVDLSWLDHTMLISLSHDGRFAVVSEQSHADHVTYEAQLRATDGTPPKRLGVGVGWELSPDGSWVAAAPIGDKPELWLLPASFGDKRPLTRSGIEYQQARWFPDGRRLLVLAAESGKRPRWWVQPIDGDAITPVSDEGDWEEAFVMPDGEYFVTLDVGRMLRLHPVAGGAPRAEIQLADTEALGGPAAGGAIYVFHRWSVPAAVEILDPTSGTRRPYASVTAPDPTGLVEVVRFWGTADGRTYAYTAIWLRSVLYLVSGVA